MTNKKDFIDLVVNQFYKLATTDIMIGHQFRKIALQEKEPNHPLRPPLEAFAHHLPRIKSFWYIQLLGEKKSPEQAPFDLIKIHRPLFIRMGELNRWLTLFNQVLKEQEQKSNDPQISELVSLWEGKVSLFENKFKKTFF